MAGVAVGTLYRHFPTKTDLVAAVVEEFVAQMADDKADEDRASAALTTLIQAAQSDGDLHADVGVADIYLLFASAPTELPPAARARWLALVLFGLSPRDRQ